MESKAGIAAEDSSARRNKRRVVRCPKCGLVQFWPEGKTACVRPGCTFQVAYRLTAKMELKPEAGASEPLPEERFKARAFAARLRELRKARGMTQMQMAEKMHTVRTFISKIESNGSSALPKTVLRMAGVLGIEMKHLLDERLSVEDLTTRTPEDLRAHEAFLDEIAEMLPGIEPWNLLILSKAAEAMATRQYTLPEWMSV